jgi:hypothetical protein
MKFVYVNCFLHTVQVGSGAALSDAADPTLFVKESKTEALKIFVKLKGFLSHFLFAFGEGVGEACLTCIIQ